MLDRLGRPPSAPVVIPAGHRLSTATEQGRHRDGPVASCPEALTNAHSLSHRDRTRTVYSYALGYAISESAKSEDC